MAKDSIFIFGGIQHGLEGELSYYIHFIFTDSMTIDFSEVINEFHLKFFEIDGRVILGPFPDNIELKKIAFEIGEYLESEKIYLLDVIEYNSLILDNSNTEELMKAVKANADVIPIVDPNEQKGFWNKIFT
ncbi:MAG: hypothetical protein ACPGJV_09305 [Bacteriovoracaceae bacterium]